MRFKLIILSIFILLFSSVTYAGTLINFTENFGTVEFNTTCNSVADFTESSFLSGTLITNFQNDWFCINTGASTVRNIVNVSDTSTIDTITGFTYFQSAGGGAMSVATFLNYTLTNDSRINMQCSNFGFDSVILSFLNLKNADDTGGVTLSLNNLNIGGDSTCTQPNAPNNCCSFVDFVCEPTTTQLLNFSIQEVVNNCNVTIDDFEGLEKIELRTHSTDAIGSNTFYDDFKIFNLLSGSNKLPFFNISVNSPLCVDNRNDFGGKTTNITIEVSDLEDDTILFATQSISSKNFNRTIKYNINVCNFFSCTDEIDTTFLTNTVTSPIDTFEFCEFSVELNVNVSTHNVVAIDGTNMLFLNGACGDGSQSKAYKYNLGQNLENIFYFTDIFGFGAGESFNLTFYDQLYNPASILRFNQSPFNANYTVSEFNGTVFNEKGVFSNLDSLQLSINAFASNLNQSFMILFNQPNGIINLTMLNISSVSQLIIFTPQIVLNITNSANLVLHFEEQIGVALDSSPTGLNFTPNSVTQTSTGIFGNAYSYDGTTSYLNTSDNSATRNKTVLSFSVWIKPASSKKQDVFSFSDGLTVQERFFLTIESDEKILFGGIATDGTSDDSLLTTSGLIEIGEWNHIAGVIDFSNSTIKIYHNGTFIQEDLTATFVGTVTSNTDGKFNSIGATKDGSGDFFDGQIDELMIFPFKLTPANISLIFNETNLTQTLSTNITVLINKSGFVENIRYVELHVEDGTTLQQKEFIYSGVFQNPNFTTNIPTNLFTTVLGSNYFDIFITDSFNINKNNFAVERVNVFVQEEQFCTDRPTIQCEGIDCDYVNLDELSGVPLLISKLFWWLQFPFRWIKFFGFVVEVQAGVLLGLLLGFMAWFRATHNFETSINMMFISATVLFIMKFVYIDIYILVSFLFAFFFSKSISQDVSSAIVPDTKLFIRMYTVFTLIMIMTDVSGTYNLGFNVIDRPLDFSIVGIFNFLAEIVETIFGLLFWTILPTEVNYLTTLIILPINVLVWMFRILVIKELLPYLRNLIPFI